jgi:hypothetical protein
MMITPLSKMFLTDTESDGKTVPGAQRRTFFTIYQYTQLGRIIQE